MKPKLLIVTGNNWKFQQLAFVLNDYFDCEQKDWNEPDIQGSAEEILDHKIKRAYEIFKCPVLVDDVSVHFETLNGFPGPYMKDFFTVMTPYEMGHKFAGSKIKAICRLGLCRGPEDILIAEGEFNGVVIAPKNEDHQGKWFELFVKLDGMDKPMIEYLIEEKNKFSHRGKAMQKLLDILKNENI